MHQQRTVIVTGGSSGIGFELCKLFARDKYRLILVARDQEKLSQAKVQIETEYHIRVDILSCDLSNSDAAEQVYEFVFKLGVHVDILVNNAGSALYGAFAHNDLDDELALLNIYAITVTKLCKLFLPSMLEKKDGRILNVVSMAAFQAMPYMAVYAASKAYLLHFTEALSSELQGSGVTASALCPCATRTNAQKQANMEDWKLVQGPLMDAGLLANIGYRGLMKGQAIIIPDLRSQILYGLGRVSPRWLALKIAKFVIQDRS